MGTGGVNNNGRTNRTFGTSNNAASTNASTNSVLLAEML